MLGRKQSVRNNEDWKNALDHIEETVSKKELDSLVKKTVKDIKEKCKGKKAAYAWSAGKDSLVLGEICEKAGIDYQYRTGHGMAEKASGYVISG